MPLNTNNHSDVFPRAIFFPWVSKHTEKGVKYRCEICLPHLDRDKKPVNPEKTAQIKDELLNRCGGWTLKLGLGSWMATRSDVTHFETSEILLTDTVYENVTWLIDNISRWANVLNQEVLMVTVHPVIWLEDDE